MGPSQTGQLTVVLIQTAAVWFMTGRYGAYADIGIGSICCATASATPASARCAMRQGNRDANHLGLWRQLTKRKSARDLPSLRGRQGRK